MKRSPALLAALIGAASTCPVWANGTRLPEQDAWAMARADAVVAGISNPAAVYYNPAGLTAIHADEVSAGVNLISSKTDFTSASTGRTVTDGKSHFAQPEIFAAAPLGGATIGVGVFSPFGLSTDWAPDSGFAGLATFNEIRYVTGEVAVAWKPVDTVSVGAGLQFSHIRANLNRLVAVGVTPSGTVVPAPFGYIGSGDALSANVGIQWQVTPRNTLGVHYQRKTDFRLHGTARLGDLMSQPGVAGWVFPEDISAGWQWAFAPRWQAEVAVDWTNWNRVNALNLAAGPLTTTVPLNWKSSTLYSIGVSNSIDARWSWAAGYLYNENSVPEASLTPSLPDVARRILSAGLFCNVGDWKVGAAFQRGLHSSTTRTDPQPDGLGGSGVGTYHNRIWAADLFAALRF